MYLFKRITSILIGSFVLLGTIGTAQALTARQIMEKVDARDDGDHMTADIEMVLIDKRDNRRIRKMKVFIKDKGKDTWKLQFFVSPADVRDTGFLTYDYYEGDRDDDQWLYLPDLHKTKRIATSDKSSAFMGSDFSYADMTRRVLDEWTYKLLRESEVNGHKVWLIEALPVSREVETRYGYTKSVLFVRQDIFMGVRAVHWLKEGKKIKYQEMRGIKQIDGIWVSTEFRMKTTKNKVTLHKTVMKWSNIQFNQPIDDDLFTVRRLEKGI
ncbi:MAG: outer membrane lipoprotein-sorting protein [Deltaproteobacteria bacterium]|nr:MAG: outer membrane lipoprotein-sorting protein [Deltaproteobacteria bacterium]